MTHIRPVFKYDIRPLAQALAELGEDAWGNETWRQTVRNTPHAFSQTIFLRRQLGKSPRDILTSLVVEETPYCMIPAFDAALWAISKAVGAPLAKAMIVRLAAMAMIKSHTDAGAYADATERYHLPIVTNPEAWLDVDGERVNLAAGTVYWFEKHREHSGANLGRTPRVHMIVDTWR